MRYITAAIAMASGFIVLAGYIYPLPVLIQIRAMLTDWAIAIGGMAILVGIVSMVFTHMGKIRRREKNSGYGALLIVSMIVTAAFGGAFGLDSQFIKIAVSAIIVPVEASLMAILAITLIYASIRLLRRRSDFMTIIFLVVAILSLVAVMPTPIGPVPGDFVLLKFLNMLSSGGARGLLIGIALGTLLTGLRVLFGIDRPYGGN